MKVLNQEVSIWKKSYNDHKFPCAIFVISPMNLDTEVYIHKLKNMIVYFYLSISLEKKRTVQDLFVPINAHALYLLGKARETNQTAVLGYIKFEGMKKFIKIGGEIFANKIKKFILNSIKEKLHEKDIIYILSPRDYFLISTKNSQEYLEKSLKQIRFQMEGLLIFYKAKFFTVSEDVSSLSDIWGQIFVE